jgi:hypothetical protein
MANSGWLVLAAMDSTSPARWRRRRGPAPQRSDRHHPNPADAEAPDPLGGQSLRHRQTSPGPTDFKRLVTANVGPLRTT